MDTQRHNFDYVILSSGLHSSFRINKPLICTSCSIWYRHAGGNIVQLIFKFSFIWSKFYFYIAVVLTEGFQRELCFARKHVSNIHDTPQHPEVPQLWQRPPSWMKRTVQFPIPHAALPFPREFLLRFYIVNSKPEDNSFLINLWTPFFSC